MLLLVGDRACTIAHAVGRLFRLSPQFARFLAGAIGQVFGLFLRRLGAASGLVRAGAGQALRRAGSWGLP
jgi:hypothetical protein